MTTVEAQTRSINDARHYVMTDDKGVRWDVPSVSTVKRMMASPALEGWQINRHILATWEQSEVVGRFTHPTAVKRYVRSVVASDTLAQDYGNDVHRIAEAVLLGRPLPDWSTYAALTRIEADKIVPLLEGFVERFEVEPVMAEQAVVYIDEWGRPVYAGTLDLMADLTLPPLSPGGKSRRVRAVVDWKSGASGLWQNDVVSTGGYQHATHTIDHRTSKVAPIEDEAETSVLVHVRHTGLTVHEIETEDSVEVLTALARLLKWSERSKASVIGPNLLEEVRPR